MKKRCSWANSHELLAKYHDEEWGNPTHNDRRLFEMLNLEGAQAGLSWLTVLKKRDNYRKAFYNFDPQKLIKFTAAKQKSLMKNEGIIRNRLKINAVVENAKAYLLVQKEFGGFNKYIWSFSDGKPTSKKKAVAVSEAMSKDLKKRGFRFVGATICYAFMQATGILDDHMKGCYKFKAGGK